MKVMLVDDHTLVRKGIAQILLMSVPEVELSEAETADQAMEVLRETGHDVVLLDIRMPGRDGIELLKEIHSFWPALPVIMLTCFDNAEYVKAALANGAAGYLLKDSTPEDLAQAINVALTGGGSVLSPRAVKNLFEGNSQADSRSESRSARASDAGLTKREIDIMALLAEGLSNREISRSLFLSEKTVKAHLAAIFRKLSVTNRTQAAMAAVAMGLGRQNAYAATGTSGANSID
jgi:two-component system response regulator DegU